MIRGVQVAIAALVVGAVLVVLAWPPPAPELGANSRYMHAPPPGATERRPFRLDDPERYALIVYVNGSRGESRPDSCRTARPGLSVPPIVVDLAGMQAAGRELLVFAFCTRTKLGGFDRAGGDGVPKVVRRAEELEALLQHIAARGFPPERIFVMGQSAGAWAGLLLQRRGAAPHAGLVGFAPAFSGRHAGRSAAWMIERARQSAYIRSAPRLEALIFGFEEDSFEPVRMMGWLRAIPGVDYVALSGRSIGGIACSGDAPHATVFRDCFRQTQKQRILEYLSERLEAVDPAPPPEAAAPSAATAAGPAGRSRSG
jgi:hypothetical protein